MLVRKHGPRVADRQRLRIAVQWKDLALKPGASRCRAFTFAGRYTVPPKKYDY